MGIAKRTIAATELLLILPAALFMTSLLVRTLQPLPGEPARIAAQIVQWYAERQWTLWILLIALPLAVLATGCATLFQEDVRRSIAAIRTQPATVLVAVATSAAAVFLLIAVLHMLGN